MRGAGAGSTRWGFAVAALAALVLAVGAVGCGGDDEPSVATDSVADTTEVTLDEGAPTDTGGSTAMSVDACSLLGEDDLAAVFSDGAPEGDGNDYGGGFGDCRWESDAGFVSVTIVPALNFASDYVDQLNVGGPVESDALGDDAVSFPGIVGIGLAKSGGATVGFTKGDAGYLVAAQTGAEGGPDDLAKATTLAETVAGNV
jgi:hypothetical protein